MPTKRLRLLGTRLLACTAATLLLLPSGSVAGVPEGGNEPAAAPPSSPKPQPPVPHVDGKPVTQWIEQLGADDFATREKATTALSKAGKEALPLLEEAARSPDPEVRWRAQKALEAVRKRQAVRGGDTPRTEPAERGPGELPDPFAELERALRGLAEPDNGFGEEDGLDALLPKEFQRMFEQLQRELFRGALRPGAPDRPGVRSRFMVLRFKDGKWVLEEAGGASQPRDPVGVDPLPLSPLVRAQLRLGDDAGFAIERVRPGGLAARAGLERFDVVLELDGKPVRDASELEALEAPGTHTITIVRGGERRTIEFAGSAPQPDERETPKKY